MKTSLGVWALGPMVTRFVRGGYQPDRSEPVPEKVHRAVTGLGDLKRSVLQWRFTDEVAGRIDETALKEAQSRKDAVRAYELVYAALGA